MKTPVREPQPFPADPRRATGEDEDEDTGEDDAPPVPDEEPDGEPDPAFE
jgi:hypothetical protein